MLGAQFMTVDYALAVDVLPSEDDAAKDLGIWGIAAFIGGTMGPMLCTPTGASNAHRTCTPARKTCGCIPVWQTARCCTMSVAEAACSATKARRAAGRDDHTLSTVTW